MPSITFSRFRVRFSIGSQVPGRVGLATLPSGGTGAPRNLGPVPRAENRTIQDTMQWTSLLKVYTIPQTSLYWVGPTTSILLDNNTTNDTVIYILKTLSEAAGVRRNGDNLLIHRESLMMMMMVIMIAMLMMITTMNMVLMETTMTEIKPILWPIKKCLVLKWRLLLY